jgi:fructokinase
MFLVCGEALMDVFVVGETAGGLSLDARVGGSPFNVAVGLARMGQPVALFTGLSQDFSASACCARWRPKASQPWPCSA